MNDTIKTILGAIGIFLVVMFVFANVVGSEPTQEDLEKTKWANAAASCWKGYERKSLTADDKVAVAKFCEDMEAKAK